MTQKQLNSVLVTGAYGALGTYVVNRFLDANCHVYGTFFGGEKPKDLPGKRLTWIEMNVTDSDSIRKGLSQIEGGSPEALIHCAGGFRFLPSEQVSEADLEFLFNLNLKSAFLLVREILPKMKKKNFGRIVFISSRATLNAGAGMGAYAASKAGLNCLTQALAEEVKAFDINVNAVLPTVIDTPVNRKDMPNADFSQWVPPNDLAEIIFSLTQGWGKSIHGALMPVAGRV